MKIVEQKVKEALVYYKENHISSISEGYVFYIGVNAKDSFESINWALKTICNSVFSSICNGLEISGTTLNETFENEFDNYIENISDYKLDFKSFLRQWVEKQISCEKIPNILLLSQFTLLADFKGNKPSFHKAESNDIANTFFNEICEAMKSIFPNKVKNGLFGKSLDIHLIIECSDPIKLYDQKKSL